MKNIYKLLFVTILSFSVISCDDYVDYDPSETYTIVADDYFTSSSDYESALVGVYDVTQWILYNVMIGEIASDNSLAGGESATDVIGLQKIDDMLHDPENDQLTSVWQFMYEGVNRANYLFENKDKLDFTRKDELYGEVHFLRAFFYFELVKIFGDVPLFTNSRLTAVDSGTLQRSSSSDVYAQIETDLNAAIAALPAEKSVNGRATSLLIGAYGLPERPGSVFLKSGENGAESVYEIQHTKDSNWWAWDYVPQGTEGNFAVIHHGIRGYVGDVYQSGWSFNVPTQDLVDAFPAGDKRKDASVLDIVKWADDTGAEYGEGYEHTGYFNHKYIPRQGESSAQQELNFGTNYRAIRYADVLLMAAEANNRKSSPDTQAAQNYLNEVRKRAFGNESNASSSTGATLTQEIWDERRLELAGEGHRFFDLVRTGQASTVLQSIGFQAGKHEVFPIPQKEIDISNLTQNNGY